MRKTTDLSMEQDRGACLAYGLVDLCTDRVRYIGKSTSGFRRPKDQFGVVYPSASEAARFLGVFVTNSVKVLHGKRKSAGGRVFSYA